MTEYGMITSWAVVNMVDGLIFEGIIKAETSYGVYLMIGGNEDRVSLFPWHVVSRVIYKVNS